MFKLIELFVDYAFTTEIIPPVSYSYSRSKYRCMTKYNYSSSLLLRKQLIVLHYITLYYIVLHAVLVLCQMFFLAASSNYIVTVQLLIPCKFSLE